MCGPVELSHSELGESRNVHPKDIFQVVNVSVVDVELPRGEPAGLFGTDDLWDLEKPFRFFLSRHSRDPEKIVNLPGLPRDEIHARAVVEVENVPGNAIHPTEESISRKAHLQYFTRDVLGGGMALSGFANHPRAILIGERIELTDKRRHGSTLVSFVGIEPADLPILSLVDDGCGCDNPPRIVRVQREPRVSFSRSPLLCEFEPAIRGC